jgi:hypothetical protein
MIGAVAPLIERAASSLLPREPGRRELARAPRPARAALRAGLYEAFVVDTLLPFIRADCGTERSPSH